MFLQVNLFVQVLTGVLYLEAILVHLPNSVEQILVFSALQLRRNGLDGLMQKGNSYLEMDGCFRSSIKLSLC